MPKKKEKTKNRRPENIGDGLINIGDPQRVWKAELQKKFNCPDLKVDFSRGPQQATVALQPGQTREELEKHLGCTLEDYAVGFMEKKKENRLWYARFGYVLYPGPNGIYDASFVTNGYIPGSLAEKYKFDKLDHLMNNLLILKLRWEDDYINAKDCSWEDVSTALQFYLRWDEAEEDAYIAEGCELSRFQIEKKTCKHLVELMLEMTTKLNELNGAGPDDRPTLPKEYDVYQKIWTEILEKIKVEATDYTDRATKHFPDWAKETMRTSLKRKKKNGDKKTDDSEKKKDAPKWNQEVQSPSQIKGCERKEEKKKVTPKGSEEMDPQKEAPLVLPPPSKFPHPIVKWAQRRDLLFITICIQDCKNPEIKVEENKLYFKGRTGMDEKVYEVEIEFFEEIDTGNSKYAIHDREIEFALEKKECGPYWTRLTKMSAKQQWLKIDFDKWLDETEGSTDEDGSSNKKPWHPEDYMKKMSPLDKLRKREKDLEETASANTKEKWNPDDDSDEDDESAPTDELPELE